MDPSPLVPHPFALVPRACCLRWLKVSVAGPAVRADLPVGTRSVARSPATYPVAVGRAGPHSQGWLVQLMVDM